MIFIEEKNVFENTVEITGQEFIHLAKVLRVKNDEKIVVNDEKIVYNVFISSILKDKIICEIIDRKPVEIDVCAKIYVYISATKGDKMELVTQKVTELGAWEITPFVSKRTIVKFDEKSKKKKAERLQIIAKEAGNQCKSQFITKVNAVKSFNEMIEDIKTKELSIVCYENEKNIGLSSIISKEKFDEIAVIIGPEGGFEQDEIEKIVSSGAKVATLGNRILRAETAPIAVVTAIMYEKGAMN